MTLDVQTAVSVVPDENSKRGVIWENNPDAATLSPFLWGTPADATRLNANAPVPKGQTPRYLWKPHPNQEQRGEI